ncbi:thermonuclease family protein [Candidatus Kaiserbacteria bacterium]|nr:thermonuclease family protein [Candidatus Kaiserbacteria bacterium]
MRKRHISLIALVLALALYGVERYSTVPMTVPERSSIRSASAAVSPTRLYPVVKVVDGDTIDILKDGTKMRVRLLGIDTPEVVDPRKPVQCFGREASIEAHRLLDDTSVRVETDPSQDTYDKYGRLLAYVRLPDDTFVNKYMIARGYGCVSPHGTVFVERSK